MTAPTFQRSLRRAGAGDGRRFPTSAAAGCALAVLLAAGLLLWSKWAPYTTKAASLLDSRGWSGGSTLAAAGIHPGAAPSWSAAFSFAHAYGLAVWKALAAALVIAAAAQSLVPRAWLVGVLSRRRTWTSAMAGGAASMPSMMCTCCTAPVAVALRRCGAPTSAVLAYWMGNPLLNPAVLVFLALVAPWQWVVTRAVIGALLVTGGATAIARFARRREIEPAAAGLPGANDEDEPFRLAAAPLRFAKALGRLVVTLVPEYAVVVLLVGAFGGWLFPMTDGSSHQPLATLAAVLLGTLLVIPTAGEIPLAQGLSATGASVAVIGALLVTLPAVSLPSLVMVGRALTWRVTVAAAVAVAAAGGLAAALLVGLT